MATFHNKKNKRITTLVLALVYLVVLAGWGRDAGAIFNIVAIAACAGLLGALTFMFAAVDELKEIANELWDEQTMVAKPTSVQNSQRT